ncbi:hypothetical protein [Pseudomonas brassicacearum]|uniref:hypothetical protein n=1 Tax=Pseudomonas brassicacearum TaxID=930166 RepID=UPI0011CDB73F|nr:hypothetical protein [Pseudomonas brassicacearum]
MLILDLARSFIRFRSGLNTSVINHEFFDTQVRVFGWILLALSEGYRLRLLLFFRYGLPLQFRGLVDPAKSAVGAGAPAFLSVSMSCAEVGKQDQQERRTRGPVQKRASECFRWLVAGSELAGIVMTKRLTFCRTSGALDYFNCDAAAWHNGVLQYADGLFPTYALVHFGGG